MEKIILYYRFAPLNDPEAVKLWQSALASNLNLKGRVIISPHGINGTLGGDIKELKTYIKQTKAYPKFKDMVFKWSDGRRDDFPKLSVKVRSELVTFGVADKLKVTDDGIVGGGKRLKPDRLQQLVEEKGDKLVFVDGRNSREAAIGKFKDAVVFNVNHTRDFPKAIKDPKYTGLKDKTIVTYCTGGIRCEVLSKLMVDEGFKDVYQLDGGIAKYLEKYGDDGLWEGSLFVFDDRLSVNSSDHTKIIGECIHCGAKTSNYINCSNTACNELVLVCQDCSSRQKFSCSACLITA